MPATACRHSSDQLACWPAVPAAAAAIAGPMRTLAAAGAPVGPMQRLVEANLLDQRVHVYASFPDLLGYCGSRPIRWAGWCCG